MINIVMYHYIRNNEDYVYNVFARRKEEFIRQVNYFKKNFEILNPYDIDAINYHLLTEEKKTFILTFDDGYKDHVFCSNFLKSLNLSGIFFPPSNVLNQELLDVNIIHFLIGQRNINIKSLLNFILEQIKIKDFKVTLNQKPISIDYYLKNKFESRLDNKDTLIIKRLLQRDIQDSNNRKFLLFEAFKNFTNYTSEKLAKELYLTRKDIIEMKNNGMLFGSHGLNHSWLDTLSYKEQYKEINESFKILEKLNVLDASLPKFICYPYGGYNKDTLKINKNLNIDFGLTSKVGMASSKNIYDSYQLQRWDTNDFWAVKENEPISSCIN